MKAVLPVFDENRSKPYYLQLYEYLKKSILNGDVAENEKLPSLRNLAKSTGLSITTIEQAYNQLLVEGYIRSKPQSGYYVARVFSHPGQTVPAASDILYAEVFPHDGDGGSSLPEMLFDPECFDFNKWKKCMNKILTEYSHTLFFESNPQGEPGLRAELTKYLLTARGVSCSPEQIVIGAGTQQITNQLATLLKKLGIEHVAFETPGYLPVRNAFRDRGFAITPVSVAEDGPAIEKLPANISTAAYVSPSNNTFTGSIMPIGRRYQLLNWAAANDSYIIEDDYDSELRYFGRPIPSLKSLDSDERVVYLGSFSSTLFAAVKISYMVLPSRMTEAFSEMAGDYSQTCSKLEQLTLATFMEMGYYQTHIKKLRKLYSQKLNAVIEAFNSRGTGFVHVKNKSSGVNITVSVETHKSPEQLKRDAESVGIPSIHITNPSSLILYYNQIPLKDISKTITRLLELWSS